MSEQPAEYSVGGENITDELARYGDEFDDILYQADNDITDREIKSGQRAAWQDKLRLIAGRAAAQAVTDQWVSVNDRLPEPGREVPISVLDTVSNVERRYLSCGAWSPNDYEGYWTGYRYVTHWLDVRLPPIALGGSVQAAKK